MGELLDDRYRSWMVADPAVVLRAVDVLRADADGVQAVTARLAGLLGSSAAGLAVGSGSSRANQPLSSRVKPLIVGSSRTAGSSRRWGPRQG
jgi:hypothetical protein